MPKSVAATVAAVVAAGAGVGPAARASDSVLSPSRPFAPIVLSLQPVEPESVYAPPAPPREDEGVNEGGVNLELQITYFTDYIFRGVERFEPPGAEDQATLQIYSKLTFDLGRVPHPFVSVFANIAENDPISTFQEIRPTVGLEWFVRPLEMSAGYSSYIFPDRDEEETQEIWGRLQVDDSYFLKSNDRFLSPYVMVAYDIDLYDGWYVEGGVEHDFVIENTGLVLTANASVAYVRGNEFFDADLTDDEEEPSGFQHYQVGLIGRYSLNHLLNVSQRYGEWTFNAYLFYTDGIDDDLRSETQLWGGAGIGFSY